MSSGRMWHSRPAVWVLLSSAAVLVPFLGALAFDRLRAPAPAPNPDWNRATPWPDRVILTWSGDPATTQSITWRTDTTVSRAVAQYALASPGPGFGHDARTVEARSTTLDARHIERSEMVVRYHAVTLTELASDTVYAYRVGDGTRWTEWFHFRTASPERRPFSFIYLGDAQTGILGYWSRAIRRSFIHAPDARFIVHAGDLVSNAQSDREWGEWFRAGGWIHAVVPSVPAAGNHEYRPFPEDGEGDPGNFAVVWRPQFTLPANGVAGEAETSYYLDYQGVRLVVLNSSGDRAAQAAWLDTVLTRNPHPWTVVTSHHPIYSSARERDNPGLRALWKPIIDRHAVDLVLQGHDHLYARGHTAGAEQNGESGPQIRDGSTGPVYVVSVSGPRQYRLTQRLWERYEEATLDRRAENTQLYQIVRVAGDTLQFRSYTVLGMLYDSFDLIRAGRDRGTNQLIEHMPRNAATRSFSDGPRYPYAR